MKKITALFLSIILLFSLFSCAGGQSSSETTADTGIDTGADTGADTGKPETSEKESGDIPDTEVATDGVIKD